MEIITCSRTQIETQLLPGPGAVICLADSREQLARIRDSSQVVARLDVIFNDSAENFGQVRAPTLIDAKTILRFMFDHQDVPFLVAQCQRGVGRSMAILAAALKIGGLDNRHVLAGGTYNRTLYRLLLAAAGTPDDPEPLVSMNVRVKYAPDRLRLFLLCMRRQRYENWEVVAVTDGPNPQAVEVVQRIGDRRIRLFQTSQPRGHWGHPYRQFGIDQCQGEYIGMSNDDNYYVPGYLEQMVAALGDADLATCLLAHNYNGYLLAEAGTDLGSWIARASLVRQTPWPGNDFQADNVYIDALRRLAGSRVATIERPLFIHN